MKNNKGVTLLELLIVLAIILIIYAVSAQAFPLFQRAGELSNTTEEIISILRLAQSKTLASEGAGQYGSQYGVYFDTTTTPQQYTLFKGSNYTSRDPASDEINHIPNSTEIYDISLGGSKEVVFSRLIGDTNNSGKISLRLRSDNSKTKTIGIQSSGKITLGEEVPPADIDTNRLKDSRHVYFNYSRFIDTTTEVITLTFPNNPLTPPYPIPIGSNMSAGQIYWEGEVTVDGQNQKIKIHTIYLNNPGFDTLFSIYRDMKFNSVALNISISGDGFGNLVEYSADGRTIIHPSSYVNNFQW